MIQWYSDTHTRVVTVSVSQLSSDSLALFDLWICNEFAHRASQLRIFFVRTVKWNSNVYTLHITQSSIVHENIDEVNETILYHVFYLNGDGFGQKNNRLKFQNRQTHTHQPNRNQFEWFNRFGFNEWLLSVAFDFHKNFTLVSEDSELKFGSRWSFHSHSRYYRLCWTLNNRNYCRSSFVSDSNYVPEKKEKNNKLNHTK